MKIFREDEDRWFEMLCQLFQNSRAACLTTLEYLSSSAGPVCPTGTPSSSQSQQSQPSVPKQESATPQTQPMDTDVAAAAVSAGPVPSGGVSTASEPKTDLPLLLYDLLSNGFTDSHIP